MLNYKTIWRRILVVLAIIYRTTLFPLWLIVVIAKPIEKFCFWATSKVYGIEDWKYDRRK
jgi:hypothetical protein